MITYKETNSGNTLEITTSDNRVITYKLCRIPQKVNQQQFNLSDGKRLCYIDGAFMMHSGDYCLLRHWRLSSGKVIDRVAIPWMLLYTEL